jgi:DNA polymerase-3 subunit beta
MKVECLKDRFAQAIMSAEKITGKNLTLPVLGCILLSAKDNALTIKATNLDLGFEVVLPVKVSREGSVAVPGSVLSAFVNNLHNDKSVHLEVIEGNLSISTQYNATTIKSLPFEDFPTIPVIEKERTFAVNAKDFVKGLKSVWYSSSTSSMKPELSSVYIYSDDEGLVFVATDSFRLAEKRVKMKKAKEIGTILIPFKNVPEIVKVLDTAQEEVEINATKNQVSFSFNGTYLVSRIIDGVFPDYKQIIPKESKTEAIILKQDIINALKILNIFSDKFNQVNIKAHPEAKIFELKTRNGDIGENVNKLQSALSGEDIEINFNYKYITDCLPSIETDSLAFNFNGMNKPLVIRGVSDRSFMYLVMPMNR